MEGQDFRERVTREDGSLDLDSFWDLWPSLRVLARCNPTDKLLIVRGAPLAEIAPPTPKLPPGRDDGWPMASGDQACLQSQACMPSAVFAASSTLVH